MASLQKVNNKLGFGIPHPTNVLECAAKEREPGTGFRQFSVWATKSPGGEVTQRREGRGQESSGSAFGPQNHQAER